MSGLDGAVGDRTSVVVTAAARDRIRCHVYLIERGDPQVLERAGGALHEAKGRVRDRISVAS